MTAPMITNFTSLENAAARVSDTTDIFQNDFRCAYIAPEVAQEFLGDASQVTSSPLNNRAVSTKTEFSNVYKLVTQTLGKTAPILFTI